MLSRLVDYGLSVIYWLFYVLYGGLIGVGAQAAEENNCASPSSCDATGSRHIDTQKSDIFWVLEDKDIAENIFAKGYLPLL